MTTSETGPSELREYLSVLWRRRYLIALTILVTLGAAIFYTQRQTPLYRSTAQVLVTPISLPLQGQQSYASVNMSSEQLVAASPEVAQHGAAAARDRRHRSRRPVRGELHRRSDPDLLRHIPPAAGGAIHRGGLRRGLSRSSEPAASAGSPGRRGQYQRT